MITNFNGMLLALGLLIVLTWLWDYKDKGRNTMEITVTSGMELLALTPYQLSVFRTLISSREITGITLQYHLENYLLNMDSAEPHPQTLPLCERVAHFLKYVEDQQ